MCTKLEESLRNYIAASNLFQETSSKQNIKVESVDIPVLLKELFALKHNGEQIERLYKAAMQGELQYQNMLDAEKERLYHSKNRRYPSRNYKGSSAYQQNANYFKNNNGNWNRQQQQQPQHNYKNNNGGDGNGTSWFGGFFGSSSKPSTSSSSQYSTCGHAAYCAQNNCGRYGK